jgi:hypothetical protein
MGFLMSKKDENWFVDEIPSWIWNVEKDDVRILVVLHGGRKIELHLDSLSREGLWGDAEFEECHVFIPWRSVLFIGHVYREGYSDGWKPATNLYPKLK